MWRWLLIGCIAFVGCSTASIKPKAAGTMYDVILAADNSESEAIVRGMLEAPVEGLPQSEPTFHVMTTGKATLTNATKYARAIVVARTGKPTKVRFERDAFAQGQTIVYIDSPSAQALKSDSARIAKGVIRLLDQAELKSEALRLAKHYNKEAKQLVEKTFGCSLQVPEDFRSSKTGRNFVWLSNNGNRTMQSICVYTYPGITLSKEKTIAMRDSILGANIEGEDTGMKMLTERSIEPKVTINGQTLTMRGLWVMKGDAMGGPFVSIAKVDSASRQTIVAEGFVYAPGQKKKLLTKQLEAAISTLKLHAQ